MYEIQGRRTERVPGRTVREVVRLDTAPTSSAAFAIADRMAADDLRVWVFETDRAADGARAYRLLRVTG